MSDALIGQFAKICIGPQPSLEGERAIERLDLLATSYVAMIATPLTLYATEDVQHEHIRLCRELAMRAMISQKEFWEAVSKHIEKRNKK